MRQKKNILAAIFLMLCLTVFSQDNLQLYWYEAMPDAWLSYSFQRPINKELALACKDGKCGLIDIKGREIIPLQYKNFTPFPVNTYKSEYELFEVFHESHYQRGIVDISGKVIVPLAYSDLRLIDNERIVACDQRGNCHMYLKSGKEVTPEVLRKYKCKVGFKNGLIPASEDGIHYGLVSEAGEWVVTPRYFDLQESKGSLWFWFNGIGKVQIVNPKRPDWQCPRFEKVVGFEDGSFWGQEKGKWYAFDASCNLIGEKQGIDSMAHHPTTLITPAIFKYAGKYGLISEKGETLLEPKFKHIQNQHGQPDWHFVVTNDDDKVGVFFNGKWVVPCEFDLVQYRREYGYFTAVRGDSTMVFDKKGSLKSSLPFKVPLGQSGQYFFDEDHKRYAWSPKTGLINLPESLKSLKGLNFILIFEMADGKFGAINTNGEQVFFGYDEIAQSDYGQSSNYCFIRKDSLWGMADLTLKYIIQPQYTKLGNFGQGTFLARKGNKVGIVNLKNEQLLPIEFDDCRVGGTFLEVKKEGLWAVYDRKSFEPITKFKFDALECKSGYFIARETKERVWRMYDKNGKQKGTEALPSYPERLRDGYFTTEKNELRALYLPSGNKLVDYKYKNYNWRWSPHLYNDRFAFQARTTDGVKVYLDENGEEILKADGLWIAPNGAYAALQTGQWRFYDRDGRDLTDLALFSFSGLTFPGIWGFGKDQNGLWHILNWAGESIFSIAADQIKEYENPSPPNDLVMEKDGGRFLIRLFDFSVTELNK